MKLKQARVCVALVEMKQARVCANWNSLFFLRQKQNMVNMCFYPCERLAVSLSIFSATLLKIGNYAFIKFIQSYLQHSRYSSRTNKTGMQYLFPSEIATINWAISKQSRIQRLVLYVDISSQVKWTISTHLRRIYR